MTTSLRKPGFSVAGERRPVNGFLGTGYPFDSANHEEEVVWGGRPCPRPVPLAGLLGGRTRASAAVEGDRPTSAPNKSWLSQMDTQFGKFRENHEGCESVG